MANSNSAVNGQGNQIEGLTHTGGVAKQKTGLGAIAITGSTDAGAWEAAATHLDGATFAASDGVGLIAGLVGTLVKSLVLDANAQLGGTVDVSVLTSGARTTTQTQADQTNAYARGIAVTLDMTVVGTGSVTLAIQGKDAVSGKYVALLTGAAVITNSTNVYRVYPGLTAAANATASDNLWRTWRVVVTANNANSATYSVGAVLLP